MRATYFLRTPFRATLFKLKNRIFEMKRFQLFQIFSLFKVHFLVFITLISRRSNDPVSFFLFHDFYNIFIKGSVFFNDFLPVYQSFLDYI